MDEETEGNIKGKEIIEEREMEEICKKSSKQGK